jgi:FkbM family methyltransferase
MQIKNFLNKTKRILNRLYLGPFDSFLKEVSGVIHVGANEGQEREHYKKKNLENVLWIEADPNVFKKLKKNISNYKNQNAINYLILDKNKKIQFNISNAQGNASSVLNLYKHKEMYPEIKFVNKIKIQAYTLDIIIKKENINIKNYQALVLDTQGSELMILQGAKNLLNNFKYIKLECANFEVYKNCPTLKDITKYLKKFNFIENKKIKIDENKRNQIVYDVLYSSAVNY